MPQFKTAKDILLSHDYLEARAKTQRYVKHEFQDYGYRLAVDLGDLAHRHVYIKLAKTVDRTLLEQAAVFALEYFKETNKGKLFMWKLAELRKSIQTKAKLTNFEHDFVVVEMGKTLDALYSTIEQKYLREYEPKLVALQTWFPPKSLPKRVTWWGVGLGWEAKLLAESGSRVRGIDIARKLVAKAKQLDLPGLQVVCQPKWLATKLSAPKQDLVWASRWHATPLETDVTYLKKFSQMLSPGGHLVLELNLADSASQQWVSVGDERSKTLQVFEKLNSLSQITEQLLQNGFGLQEVVPVMGEGKKHLLYAQLSST